MLEKINKLKELINNNKNFVVLTGAGVSTLSGIPDFRGKNGLYKKFKNSEYLLSIDALMFDTKAFFDFYKNQILLDNIKPNIVHLKLAEWEKQGKLGAIITQNIDGLHTLAGSKNVIELHGTVNINYCIKCHKPYDLDFVKKSKSIPTCSCGGIIRPHVVLYGENLHDGVFEQCQQALNNTDLLIVMGTTLTVSTASMVFNMFKGKHIVIINQDPTPYDDRAELIIRDDLKDVFAKL